jgi:3-hydroxyacyl-CoA dehydrogenase
VDGLIAEERDRLGITRRRFSDDEIVARCVMPLVNEGCGIIEQKIARGVMDIDAVYCNGYGFPRARGGPMFYADALGLPEVLSVIRGFADTLGAHLWEPTPLLCQLAEQGRSLVQPGRADG